MSNLDKSAVVTREQWLIARKQLLLHEKAFTHQRDELSAARRALPWVKIDTPYRFKGADGELSLADLFAGRSQLIVYHFMFGEGWDEGCSGCSFLADHFDGANLHLAHHDVSLVAVSHAPFAEFQAFRQRMGWKFAWVSSHGCDFNHDFQVSASPAELAEGTFSYNYETAKAEAEMPGLSVFYRDDNDDIFHTYSTYARGLDLLVGAYNFLDLMPKGRNEGEIMDWVRHHDRYENAKEKTGCH
ncbi:thioredoxin family protein [Pseudomonas sp. R5(2019)]|uniref:DUF899 domain-containing protein n=1 Tax=Pseudomonas sp. R5(2019) TaxID=2697566 RepID=UPI0014137843|nr:thioredoxin family protein [Pseudomonas sp. R5(2019)]NBA97411.1 DUF899 domain-containing protein [Pseudomonas sp. R5(2019)]